MREPDLKIEFYAAKLYLAKLAEKYKSRGYEKVFLEKDANYLSGLKDISKSIHLQNEMLDDIILKMASTIQKISKLENLDHKTKKMLVEENVHLFADMTKFAESIVKNEDMVIQAIDRFRKLEKEVDPKTKTLTRYGFDRELTKTFQDLALRKCKELTVVIFDMNNLKTTNETYGHQTGAESILKFGSVLREEVSALGARWLLSNYYGGDEWFLVLIDTSQKTSVDLVKRFFSRIKNEVYEIKDNMLSLSACAGIAHYHPLKNRPESIMNPKRILQIADTLVLKSKIQKNRNKYGNAYKVMNATSLGADEISKITKEILTLPKRLSKKTLEKKKLLELFEIRKRQNEKIMRARTLGEKKILGQNLESLNEIIGSKIVSSISKALSESKQGTLESVPKIGRKMVKMFCNEVERNLNALFLTEEEKEALVEKILKSQEFQRFMKSEVGVIFDSNIYNLEKRIVKE